MGAAAAAPAAPLLGFGPPGWVAYGVIVVGGGIAAYLLYDQVTGSDAPAVPQTDTRTDTQTRRCDRPWTARVHAQGTDCGGTTSSTIGAPPLVKTQAPVTKAEGIGLSNATWALLNRRQQEVRIDAKARLERYIQSSPPLGQRSFPASDRSGGKRYDLDNYGCTPNFVT
jgi:hypothetical protein